MGTAPRSALTRFRRGGHAWWETAISDVQPGSIVLRGRPVESLIGTLSYAGVVGLLLTGRMLSDGEAHLLEAALVAGVDHGVRAPSVAAARMAATCGVTMNSALATGLNLLGDHHGGAGERCMELLRGLVDGEGTAGLDELATSVVERELAAGRNLPGFGHQLHELDPRRAPLVSLTERAVTAGEVEGRHLTAALALEAALAAARGQPIPLNVDGATAAIYCELKFPPAAAKGLFCLSRGAGILAHTVEELESGALIKGPCPPGPDLVRYVGEP
jgi:citrate synthase